MKTGALPPTLETKDTSSRPGISRENVIFPELIQGEVCTDCLHFRRQNSSGRRSAGDRQSNLPSLPHRDICSLIHPQDNELLLSSLDADTQVKRGRDAGFEECKPYGPHFPYCEFSPPLNPASVKKRDKRIFSPLENLRTTENMDPRRFRAFDVN